MGIPRSPPRPNDLQTMAPRRNSALVIGGLRSLPHFPVDAGFSDARILVAIALPEVTGPLLQRLKTRLILSPMVWDRFDVLDAAVHLNAVGYDGEYKVVSPALPSPDIIITEVASVAPSVRFSILREHRAPTYERPALVS